MNFDAGAAFWVDIFRALPTAPLPPENLNDATKESIKVPIKREIEARLMTTLCDEEVNNFLLHK
jgi:hypothetical protein